MESGRYDVHFAEMISADSLPALLAALKKHPSVKRIGLRFAAASDCTFHQVSSGICYWDWRGPHRDKRGKATLAYYDVDGQIVILSLLAIGDEVAEMELQRGDDEPIVSVPKQDDLWEMEYGRIYSPR